MKNILYILIPFFVLFSTASYGQFWKKKTGSVSAKASGGTKSRAKRDAFSGKSKKGPNVKTSKQPRFKRKNKKNNYKHSVSVKKIKGRKQPIFSSKKKRYKSINSKPKGKSSSSSSKSSKGGRKSGKKKRK